MTAWLLRRWKGALLTLGIALGLAKLWLSRWRVQRALEATRVERDRAEIERDAARGDAAVANATTAVVVEAAESREAGHALAEEIRDVETTGDPDADRAALYDRVREIARREGADGGDRSSASVRDDAAASPGADRAAGD